MTLGDPRFDIVHEHQVYRRYIAVYDRRIRFSTTRDRQASEFHYDVVGHPQCDFQYSVTLPFHTGSRGRAGEVTILREYSQGPNRMLFALPTGGYNPAKHSSQLQSAKAELSEEAHLQGGTWHCLLPEEHPGIAELKWCANRFLPFLCIDPEEDPRPGPRDEEEWIEIQRVTIQEFRAILASGDMQLPSIATAYMALGKLQSTGLLD